MRKSVWLRHIWWATRATTPPFSSTTARVNCSGRLECSIKRWPINPHVIAWRQCRALKRLRKPSTLGTKKWWWQGVIRHESTVHTANATCKEAMSSAPDACNAMIRTKCYCLEMPCEFLVSFCSIATVACATLKTAKHLITYQHRAEAGTGHRESVCVRFSI